MSWSTRPLREVFAKEKLTVSTKARTERNWPEKECGRCGRRMRLVKTKSGWKPYELDEFKPHACSLDALDHPRTWRNLNPKDDPYKS